MGRLHLQFWENGRTLFNFTASDIATLGFAGGQLQSMEPEHNVLWVDGVYLNQNKTPADGQCALEGSGTAAAKVTCRRTPDRRSEGVGDTQRPNEPSNLPR